MVKSAPQTVREWVRFVPHRTVDAWPNAKRSNYVYKVNKLAGDRCTSLCARFGMERKFAEIDRVKEAAK